MITDRLADVALSIIVVVAVVVLGALEVIDGEVVAGLLGVLVPSPLTTVTTRRRTEPLRAPR